MIKYEIFLSYRRKGGYDTAKLLYDRLRLDGYSVSFDIDTLVNGNFDVELEQRVKNCKDFLLVLSPGIFDRFFDNNSDYDPENDWVRREIACALAEDKNIVPLFMEGFSFPKNLPDNVKDITRKNALDLNPKYFEAAYEKMKSFLISKPRWGVRHKNKIMTAISIIAIVVGSYFYFDYAQKGQLAQQKQMEMERYKDSIDSARAERLARRNKEKILYWKGNDSAGVIEQLIFEKIKEAGFEKMPCVDNGRIVGLNKANCRENAETKKFNCFYTPEINFTTCDNKPITYIRMEQRIRTEPQKNEAAAMEELVNKLKEMDFSPWIPKIKEQK